MRMQVFGRFELREGDVCIDEAALRSNKIIRLLAYILMNRSRDLSRQELMDVFWPDERIRNPEGALKNLIYRVRNALLVFGEQDWIQTIPGGYRWNPAVSVETDYEEFEHLVQQAFCSHGEESRQCLERAMELYDPRIPQRLSGEIWVETKMACCKSVFMDAAMLLACLYDKEKRWDDLERLCLRAVSVDPLEEEAYCWQIRGLIGRKNYGEAIRCYENAKKVFYEQLGIRNLKKLSRAYEDILLTSDSQAADINNLIEDIGEKETGKSAFFCEFRIFQEIFRLENRRLERTGLKEFLFLVTLVNTGTEDEKTSETGMKEGMRTLERILRENLRRGDVVTRLGERQLAALLAVDSQRDIQTVADRMREKFHKTALRKWLSLRFEIEEIGARPEELNET